MAPEPPQINTAPGRLQPSHLFNSLGAMSHPEIASPPPAMAPLHIGTYAMQTASDNNTLGLLGFGLMVAGFFQLFLHHWWRGSLMVLFIVLLMLASYYAKRPRITHRFANFLCKLFFVTFTYPGDKRAPRRSLRISVAAIISVLAVLLFMVPRARHLPVSEHTEVPAAAAGPSLPRP